MMVAQITQGESSSSQSRCIFGSYDVFLSFRGEEMQKSTFTDDLYARLNQFEVNTFLDDDDGVQVESSFEIVKAIEGSRISIIVFTENYACSKLCLDKLVKVLDCGHLVLPVFYNFDPSEVRKQTGSFGTALARHEEEFCGVEKVKRWKAALTKVANLSGWHLENVAQGYESKFIQKIIEAVLWELNRKYMDVAKHPIGIDYRVKNLYSKLSKSAEDVVMVGIYGIGGVGKTTLAKAMFNQIYKQFEGSCFLADIRSEASEKHDGLLHLQKKLLYETLKSENFRVNNVHRGINLIRERLRSKKVLIVLDDVDSRSQLEALAGNGDWFGSGSRVIITTRDEHLLNLFKVNERYEAWGLNNDEAMHLFSWHAFQNPVPSEEYVEVAKGIVTYARGLPLALTVLGSSLLGESIEEWRNTFEKLKRIPNDDIQEQLKISFDALPDDKVKAIFLDISCCLRGVDKDDAVTILDACDFFAEAGIQDLLDRCLLTIDINNRLIMHGLIQDMGREIVRQESPDEAGRRSRLFFEEDVSDVLLGDKATEVVEVMMVNSPMFKDMQLSTKAFAKMVNLRLLQIDNVRLKGKFEHLPNKLKWLRWKHCPLKYIRSKFHLESLVALDMSESKFEEFKASLKSLRSLKALNLSSCENLKRTPDFTGARSLQRLLLNNCSNLSEVQSSIGDLESLVQLNLLWCRKLKKLPTSICKLKSLETLVLNWCSTLRELPDDLGNLQSLRKFSATRTGITKLPASFGCLKNLVHFHMGEYGRIAPTTKSQRSFLPSCVKPKASGLEHVGFLPPSIASLCSLEELFLASCNLSESDIPCEIGLLSSLKSIDLSKNNFHTLPFSLLRLSNLSELRLRGCKNLQTLPKLPLNLETINLEDCTSMEKLPNLCQLSELEELKLEGCVSLQTLPELSPNLQKLLARNCESLEKLPNLSELGRLVMLDVDNCVKLAEIPGLKNLESIRSITMMKCSASLANHYIENFSKGPHIYKSMDLYLEVDEIPDWFSHQVSGGSVSFTMPTHTEQEFIGMFTWVVWVVPGRDRSLTQLTVSHITDGRVYYSTSPPMGHSGEFSKVTYIPSNQFEYQIESGEQVEFSIPEGFLSGSTGMKVKRCGIHLLLQNQSGHDQSSTKEIEVIDIQKNLKGMEVRTGCR
ncbi:disease resistance protein RUN1-like [Lycium barbarum]|uniref:disease resistance protein RUN1-like n=1 Tax=Lycium barbarum TaxID=112863 RepID=UPI00293E64D1|nr:disease resistance protein RUN1-like [Lycium barbarum]